MAPVRARGGIFQPYMKKCDIVPPLAAATWGYETAEICIVVKMPAPNGSSAGTEELVTNIGQRINCK